MNPRHTRSSLLVGSLLLIAATGVSCFADSGDGGGAASAPAVPALGRVIPAPASVTPHEVPYRITSATPIRVPGGSRKAREVADYLADVLRPSTGYALPVTADTGADGIRLLLADEADLGTEGYRLESGERAVTITARRPAGLFHGVQTLRQLLPPAVEARTTQSGPWTVPGGTVRDAPRYAYRGAMLDVARHFFTVDEVKRYIDQLALYKVNTLHLHLSDDQGWRLAVDSWPDLAVKGGATEVGGGKGGYYTKDQYRELVRYAASRYLEVIPEIDMPGHTNAVLTAYPKLNCDGEAREPYTGTKVGFSSLCVPEEITYDFVDDVIRELAELTPGEVIHIGGDEADATPADEYATFMDRAQEVVNRYGKRVMGWHQLAGARPVDGAVIQYWGYDETGDAEREEVVRAARDGAEVVLSPADRAYLDMQYPEVTDIPYLGLEWAGKVDVRRSYDWDPGAYLDGLPADAVLGIEAPLWTETLSTSTELEVMAFPRLPGLAELGWSPRSTHDWDAYRQRLAAQAPRWDVLGIRYHRSPQVSWPASAG
ncbi:beta-N-acetylhexosaminidase [Streptomyces sp. NPDC058171]